MNKGFFTHPRCTAGKVFAAVLTGILILITLDGCAIIQPVPVEKDWVNEEKRLTESIAAEGNPIVLADFYLSRAGLRLRADNPQIDYSGALEDLKKAVDLKPETATRKDVRDWLAVLGRLAHLNQEVAQLKAKNEQAGHQNWALRSNVEQLETQEQELRKTVEGLQALELQMERRRQQLR
jgi:hypothetical protein